MKNNIKRNLCYTSVTAYQKYINSISAVEHDSEYGGLINFAKSQMLEMLKYTNNL